MSLNWEKNAANKRDRAFIRQSRDDIREVKDREGLFLGCTEHRIIFEKALRATQGSPDYPKVLSIQRQAMKRGIIKRKHLAFIAKMASFDRS